MKPFHCQCCHRELGRTDGRRLVIGIDVDGRYISAGAIYRPVAIECPGCTAMTAWRPVVRGAMMQGERVAA